MSSRFSRILAQVICAMLLATLLAACGGGDTPTTAPGGAPTTAPSGGGPTTVAEAPKATEAPKPTEAPAATATVAPTEAPESDPQAQVVTFITAFGEATQDTTIDEVATQEKWADTLSALVAPAKREDVREELLGSLSDLAESNTREIPGVPADSEIQLALSFEDLETTLVSSTDTTAEVQLSGGIAKGIFVGKDADKVPADLKEKAGVEQPVTDFFGSNSTFVMEKVDGVWYLSNPLDSGSSSGGGDSGGSSGGSSGEGASRAAPLALGNAVPLQTWAVTISDVVRGEDALKIVKAGSDFNADPPEGFEYLVATVELTNISTEKDAQSVDSAVSWGITGDKNIVYGQEFIVLEKELEGDLKTGESASGQKAFLVPVDEKNLMFYVRDYSSFDPADGRFIAADEGASITGDASGLDTKSTDVGADKAAPAKLGDPVTTAGWEVKVLEVKTGEDAIAVVKEGSEFNDEAPNGFAYVAVKVSARYLGVESVDQPKIIDGLDFSITGAKGTVYEKVFVTEPDPALGATLFPGASTEGWVILAAPPEETKLALVYEPTFDDDDARYLSLE
jgi:hypothetical protein